MSHPRNVQALVRRTHEERVLAVLRERGGLSRSEIAERVGLSRTTLSEITGDLIARGAVVVVDTDAAQRTGSGRRAELLALDPASGQYVGVDLGHSRARVVVADAAHEVIASGVEGYAATASWEDRVAAGIALVERLAAERGLHFGALQGVAVGVTGTDVTTRQRVHAAFAGWTTAPVITDNNTRFAALAEATADAASTGRRGSWSTSASPRASAAASSSAAGWSPAVGARPASSATSGSRRAAASRAAAAGPAAWRPSPRSRPSPALPAPPPSTSSAPRSTPVAPTPRSTAPRTRSPRC